MTEPTAKLTDKLKLGMDGAEMWEIGQDKKGAYHIRQVNTVVSLCGIVNLTGIFNASEKHENRKVECKRCTSGLMKWALLRAAAGL